MNRYLFKGVVNPIRVNLDLQLPTVEFKHSNFPIEGSLNLFVNSSSIIAVFNSEGKFLADSNPNLETLKNVISSAIRSFIDPYCFAMSYGYDFDLEFVDSNILKNPYYFSVKGEWDYEGKNEDYIPLINLILSGKHPFLSWVFADYRLAIKYPDQTPHFSFRLLETIKSEYFGIYKIVSKQENIKKSWDNFNAQLLFDKNDHSFLATLSKHSRHGYYPALTYSEREKCLAHARDVVNRFVKLIG